MSLSNFEMAAIIRADQDDQSHPFFIEGSVPADVQSEEQSPKKRKREVPSFAGSQSEFEADFIAVKALFSKKPELFSEWQAKFASDMMRLEKRYSEANEFFNKISPKQKTMVIETAQKLNTLLNSSENVVSTGSKKKRSAISTLSSDEYEQAWQVVKFIGDPCISSVEFNYLVNIAQKLREYKTKAIFSQMETEFMKKIMVSIPERIRSNEMKQ
jgi:hypothetical protein